MLRGGAKERAMCRDRGSGGRVRRGEDAPVVLPGGGGGFQKPKGDGVENARRAITELDIDGRGFGCA
jgi:hypothetical protein